MTRYNDRGFYLGVIGNYKYVANSNLSTPQSLTLKVYPESMNPLYPPLLPDLMSVSSFILKYLKKHLDLVNLSVNFALIV